VQQRDQQCPIGRAEAHPLVTELPLEHAELVAQGKDLGVLLSITDRKQAQHGEHVGDGQIGQSHQHDRSSCRPDDRPQQAGPTGTPRLTALCTDSEQGGSSFRQPQGPQQYPWFEVRTGRSSMSSNLWIVAAARKPFPPM
jgi:hypothetical protein